MKPLECPKCGGRKWTFGDRHAACNECGKLIGLTEMTISERLARVRLDLNAVLSALDSVENAVMCVAQGRLETAWETVVAAEDLIVEDLAAPDVPDMDEDAGDLTGPEG